MNLIRNSNKLINTWIPKLPSIYQIEVMSRCNLKCQFCMTGLHYGKSFADEFDAIDPLLFHTIVNRDLGGSTFIELQYRGEPTLNKLLHDYVLTLREKVLVGFSTHGGLLHLPHALNAALDSHYVTISMDAGDKERYEKLRLGANWERLIANITLLVQQKGHKFFPIIDLQLIEFEGFEEHVKKVEALVQTHWKSAGETIRVRTVKDTQAPWTMHYEPEMRIVELCTNPWYSVSIKANGDVVPCCMVFEDVKELVYGNLNKNSLEEIWNSDEVKHFRVQHRLNHLPRFCQQCYSRSPHNLHQTIANEILQLRLFKTHDKVSVRHI